MSAAIATYPLGDVVDVIGGGTPSKRNAAFYGGDIPWATVRDLNTDLLGATEHKITKAGLDGSSAKVVPAGEVVIATRVGLGKVTMLAQDTAINQDLRGLIPKAGKKVDRKYLFYWLKSIADVIIDAGTGATVQGVKLPFVKQLPFPLPPLEEQQRIVAVLDKAFEGLSRARANAEANLQNAREVFEGKLEGVFDRAAADAEMISLVDLINIRHGFAFKSKDFKVSSDSSRPILLTPGNYGEDARLKFTEKNTKRLSSEPPNDFVFREGELTVVMTDLSSKMKILGKPAFIERANILHNQRIGRIEFTSNKLLPRWLFHFLRTQRALVPIKSTSTGTMVRHTAPKRILSLQIPLPSSRIEQQNEVERLDALETEANRLNEKYLEQINDLGDLRQSLLQQAFAGALT